MKRTLAAIATLMLVGCAGGGDLLTSDAGDSGAFTEADIEFVQGMIPHHDQAIEMAAMVPLVDVSAVTAEFADEIRAAQEPEIAEMRALLSSWGEKEDVHAMHDIHSSSTHGMMTDEEFSLLTSKTGQEFEISWLRAMIKHHEGAITMSEKVLTDGANPSVRAMASAILAAQRDEIERMNSQLNSLTLP